MLWLKQIHIVLAFVSIASFIFRGTALMLESKLMDRKFVKVSPHIVDTLLLLTGVGLAMQWPGQALQGWLPYKIVALLAYIVLGILAFRPNIEIKQRLRYWLLAVLAVGYLIGVAVFKTPASWLAGI